LAMRSQRRGAIAKRTVVDDYSGGVQQLAIRADVDIARSVEDEVGSVALLQRTTNG